MLENVTIAEIGVLLRAVLPAGGPSNQCQLYSSEFEQPRYVYSQPPPPAGAPCLEENEQGEVFAWLDLVLFEPGSRAIRDVKYERVCIVPSAHRHERERVEAYLRGWSRALP